MITRLFFTIVLVVLVLLVCLLFLDKQPAQTTLAYVDPGRAFVYPAETGPGFILVLEQGPQPGRYWVAGDTPSGCYRLSAPRFGSAGKAEYPGAACP